MLLVWCGTDKHFRINTSVTDRLHVLPKDALAEGSKAVAQGAIP